MYNIFNNYSDNYMYEKDEEDEENEEEEEDEEDEEYKFKNYSSSSSKITLYYKLGKYIPSAGTFTDINLNAYKNEFSSNVNKDKFKGYITISKNSN